MSDYDDENFHQAIAAEEEQRIEDHWRHEMAIDDHLRDREQDEATRETS